MHMPVAAAAAALRLLPLPGRTQDLNELLQGFRSTEKKANVI